MSELPAFGFSILARKLIHLDIVRFAKSGLRIALLFLFTLGRGVAGNVDRDSSIHILQSDGGGILLEYKPLFHSPARIMSSGVEFIRYDFDGDVPVAHQHAGAPEIDVRSVLLRLPTKKDNIVQVVNAEHEDLRDVLLSPVPGARHDEGMITSTYKMDDKAYRKDEFAPQQIASIVNVGETRGVVLGNLLLAPLQYNPAQHFLRKYTRIVVRVNFGSAKPLTVKPTELARDLAINDRTFRGAAAGTRPERVNTLRNSVLGTGTWFRFPIKDEGMYKLTGKALLEAGVPASTDPKTIRIFGNGGYELPLDPEADSQDDLIENRVYISDGDSVGRLDPNDYVLFYGKGTRGWNYDPAARAFSHYLNHYTETNTYWLTYGSTAAKTMTIDSSMPQVASYQPKTVTGKLFREDEKVNILGSGLQWLGQQFNSGDVIKYVHQLPNIDLSQPVRYRMLIGARSPQLSTFNVYEHSSPIVNLGLNGTDVDFFYTSNQFISSLVDVSLGNLPASDGQSILSFSFSTSSENGVGYIDWYEIFYRQFLTASNNTFAFHSDDTSGVVQYSVSGFSDNQIFAFDVSKFDSVVMIKYPTISVDTCSFRVSLSRGSVKEFYVVGQSGYNTPGALAQAGNQDLHGDTTGVDYIIITHADFMSAAQRLKTFHETQDGLRTVVVDVDQIYNEFGGGLFTPVAIRNYLRYVDSTRQPRYVLLFGDGDYDYKRVLTTGPNWIPPWESEESFTPIESYASDDYFGVFEQSGRVALGIGRLTARSLQDANTMVDKIIEYEANSVEDPWKIRVTFVADDGPAEGTVNEGFLHTEQAEALSAMVDTLFEQQKIYLYEYPTVETAVGRRKPSVNEAIDDQINQGTVVLNFTGHGNPDLWTHEHVFVVESDFPLLHNKQKYFFLVAATCNFSYFDDVTQQSGGEDLVSLPDAGAIAVFSSTRAVFSYQNFELNETLYQNLFQVDSSGQVPPRRLGDIVWRTKQVFSSDPTNDRKYFLLGDPALQIAFPSLHASLDALNRIPLSQGVQLKALSQDTLTAHVLANPLHSFISGQAQLVVYDANRTVQLHDPEKGDTIITKGGNVLFRGDESVTNGMVHASFIVPKDISYSNGVGRITLYFWNASGDGAGYTTNVRVGGSDSSASADTQGPTISLFLDSRTFRPGDVVSADPLLMADMKDEHGINTSDVSIGHHIEAWVDQNPQSIDLTNYYQSNVDNYRAGTVQFRLNGLSEGNHTLRLRAWDTYNNPTDARTTFNVVSGMSLKISNVYNYPNPFSSSTVFTFEQNQIVPVDAQIKIYTVAGRFIQSLRKTGSDEIINILWNGRDKDGDIVGNGVYLYKVIVKTVDGRFTNEALGKLSVLR